MLQLVPLQQAVCPEASLVPLPAGGALGGPVGLACRPVRRRCELPGFESTGFSGLVFTLENLPKGRPGFCAPRKANHRLTEQTENAAEELVGVELALNAERASRR